MVKSRLITTVPDASLMTMRAGWSTSTSSTSASLYRSTRGSKPGPERSSTVSGSSTRAALGKRCSITAATRCAVVKFGLRRASLRLSAERKANGTSFSMIAPPAIRAEVNTPRLILAARPCALKPDTATGPCAMA